MYTHTGEHSQGKRKRNWLDTACDSSHDLVEKQVNSRAGVGSVPKAVRFYNRAESGWHSCATLLHHHLTLLRVPRVPLAYISLSLSVCLSVSLLTLLHFFVCLEFHWPFSLSVCLSVFSLFVFSLSASICPSACLNFSLCLCPSLSVCLSVCLSLSLSLHFSPSFSRPLPPLSVWHDSQSCSTDFLILA